MRYRTKRCVKYLVSGVVLVFVIFVVLTVSATYTIYPQLEPVRETLDEIKIRIGMQNFTQPRLLSESQYKPTTIEDIIKNREMYIGENVSVKGSLASPFITFWRLEESKKFPEWYLCDAQGYTIMLLSPLPYEDSRSYNLGMKYEVRGKVVLVKLENVASKFYIDMWGNIVYSGTKMEVAIEPLEMIKFEKVS